MLLLLLFCLLLFFIEFLFSLRITCNVPPGYPVPTVKTMTRAGNSQNGYDCARIIATTVITKKLNSMNNLVPLSNAKET